MEKNYEGSIEQNSFPQDNFSKEKLIYEQEKIEIYENKKQY